MEFFRRCKTLIIPLAAIMIAATVLFFTGHRDAAWIVSSPGTFLVVMGNLGYIVLVDSRRRWPGRSWTKRLARILAFQR